VIELNPIYYDLENGKVNTNNTAQLDALAQMMRKYRSIEIELIDHTDSRGEDFYNQQLSQARISMLLLWGNKKFETIAKIIFLVGMKNINIIGEQKYELFVL